MKVNIPVTNVLLFLHFVDNIFNLSNDLTAGVIWKGDKLIDGVPETLDMLRSKV